MFVEFLSSIFLCDGGFSECVINDSQFLFTKPICRDFPYVDVFLLKY